MRISEEVTILVVAAGITTTALAIPVALGAGIAVFVRRRRHTRRTAP